MTSGIRISVYYLQFGWQPFRRTDSYSLASPRSPLFNLDIALRSFKLSGQEFNQMLVRFAINRWRRNQNLHSILADLSEAILSGSGLYSTG
jgi:hypothetical protein